MRKRPNCPVCRCTPGQGVTHLDVKLLRQLLNREIRPIRCAWSLRRKALRARTLGDLCASANHPEMGIKIMGFVQELIVYEDNRWLDEERVFDTRWYTLDALMAETEALDLGRRCDDLLRKMGHPEWTGYEEFAKTQYYWTKYYRKPDYYDWKKEHRVYLEQVLELHTAQVIFKEGLPDFQPVFTKDFYTWLDGEEEEEDIEGALEELDKE